jgi:hypothetical protein
MDQIHDSDAHIIYAPGTNSESCRNTVLTLCFIAVVLDFVVVKRTKSQLSQYRDSQMSLIVPIG